MKWTRKESGHYVSGTLHIKGAGTNWDLYDGENHIHSSKSKKECQQIAEDPSAVASKDDPEFAVVNAAKKISKSTDLDSILASLRLEIDNLSLRIASLDDSNRKLADAIMILAKHISKQSTPKQGKS